MLQLPLETLANIEEWLKLDPESSAYVSDLRLRAEQGEESARLEAIELFHEQISFGTAGLRSKVGIGFSRMNRITVQLTTQGIANFLISEAVEKDIHVIVGHDHRRGSREFAEVTAATFASKGIKVSLFGQIVPTPYVPFAVAQLRADFGVMITASHNPKDDNGYKVYGRNACQIKSPVDKQIAALISKRDRMLWDIPIGATFNDPFSEIDPLYVSSTVAFWRDVEIPDAKVVPKIVYTPMHGVGLKFIKQVISSAGLPELIPVQQQAEPDRDFPTVKFPNPEEGAGALKLAFETANSTDATNVFANDPDADRFNFAEKQPNGDWRIFNGNQIALLLADFLYRSKGEGSKVAMISSLVSSRALGWMAEEEGFLFEQAETGFKNLAAKAVELQARGYNVLLTYEEAIGYMVGTNVWDKDGISALLTAYHMVINLSNRGLTLSGHLDALFARYGYQIQYNSYYYSQAPGQSKKVFTHLQRQISCLSTPCQIGAYHCIDIKNYAPASSMVVLAFEELGGAWIAIRTSGTEPKIKFYSECRTHDKDQVELVGKQLNELVTFVCETLLDPTFFDLEIQQ